MSDEYYLVISTFYDDGRVKASIHTEPHDKKPENQRKSNDEYDTYFDWFDKYEDTLKYKNDCKNA